MSDNNSPFAEDWRESLREHYKDVVRRNDTLTEKTLVGVLHDVGFTDDELRQLKLEATMRAEDLVGDFIPDLDLHDHHHEEPEASKFHAGVAIEPVDEEDLPPVDETDIAAGEPLSKDEAVVSAGADGNITVYEKTEGMDETPDENEAAELPEDDDEAPEDDADAPMQISMF